MFHVVGASESRSYFGLAQAESQIGGCSGTFLLTSGLIRGLCGFEFPVFRALNCEKATLTIFPRRSPRETARFHPAKNGLRSAIGLRQSCRRARDFTPLALEQRGPSVVCSTVSVHEVFRQRLNDPSDQDRMVQPGLQDVVVGAELDGVVHRSAAIFGCQHQDR